MKVYKCNQCGNIISMISASGVPVMCCGKKMEEMVPNTVDASAEKHVPVVEVTANKVEVVIGRNGYRIIQNPDRFCFGMDASDHICLKGKGEHL